MHDLIAPTVNLVLVVSLLTYFVRKPLKKMVYERRGQYKLLVDEAAQQKREAEAKYQEFAKHLDGFESEARAVLERAQADGQALKEKIVRDAHAAAERIIQDAENTAAANAQELRERILRETIAQAVALTEGLVAKRLTGEEQHRLVADYVKGVQNS